MRKVHTNLICNNICEVLTEYEIWSHICRDITITKIVNNDHNCVIWWTIYTKSSVLMNWVFRNWWSAPSYMAIYSYHRSSEKYSILTPLILRYAPKSNQQYFLSRSYSIWFGEFSCISSFYRVPAKFISYMQTDIFQT